MPDAQVLWSAAGKLVDEVPPREELHGRWRSCVERAASLIEPGWVRELSGGVYSYALPTVALFLYTLDDDPVDIAVERVHDGLSALSAGEAVHVLARWGRTLPIGAV